MIFDNEKLRAALTTSRRDFNATNFKELDKALTPQQREEWNAIYASYDSHSMLRGSVIGVETVTIPNMENEGAVIEMPCMVVMQYLVKVLIPEPLFWNGGPFGLRADSVIGAGVSYVVVGVDREGECAVASRTMALEQERRFARNVRAVQAGDIVTATVLAVGPSRLTATACGYDVTMRFTDLSYAYMEDLREYYKSGQEIRVKITDTGEDSFALSARDVGPDPYDNADVRHPIGSSRVAVISNKYAGGVFCRLSDGCTIVCRYAQEFADDQFAVGDHVLVQVRSFDDERRWLRGKIRGRV